MKVLVGISGGVDSAVAAHLLIKQGYEVTGAFMRNWDSTTNNDYLGNPTLTDDVCPQEQDYQDALKVCINLGIELLRIDFVKEYWDNVFTYFINEYKIGNTPNPDILCNKYIKFDYFLKYALKNGFDYLATGHYAGVKHTTDGSFLLKAVDENKDQTYFLSELRQSQIEKALFPLAEYTKQEIRAIASKLDLVVADKKDSTGICFIGERDFVAFLQNYIPAQPGSIVEYDTKTIIGQHIGCMYYTIGQSKGLGIGGHKDFPNGKWYVIGKNIEKQIVYVSMRKDHKYLKTSKVLVTNFIMNNDSFKGIKQASAKFRYRQPDTDVLIEWLDETSCLVTADNLPLAITNGQECVLYSGVYCLGGGKITAIYNDEGEITYV